MASRRTPYEGRTTRAEKGEQTQRLRRRRRQQLASDHGRKVVYVVRACRRAQVGRVHFLGPDADAAEVGGGYGVDQGRDEQGFRPPSIRHPDSPREQEQEEDDDSVYDAQQPATRFGYPDGEQGQATETGLDRKKGQVFSGAHGEMEWGDAPKKSFVLFGVDDDE